MANKLNMMIHCGAEFVDLEQVKNVNEPDPTDSWHPISHWYLIDQLLKRLPQYGLQIVEQAHALKEKGAGGKAGNGDQYFGMLQVEPINEVERNDDFSFVLGVRNSHDKSFAAGLVLGNGVFVCDNLCFSGEVKLARRHTTNIMRDLPNVINRALSRLIESRTSEVQRIEAYKETEFNDVQAKAAILDMFRGGAFPAQRIPQVLEQWETPAHPEFKERTAWSLFNGVTEVLKKTSIMALPDRTTKLHGVMDSLCGLVTDVNVAQQIADDLTAIDADFEVVN